MEVLASRIQELDPSLSLQKTAGENVGALKLNNSSDALSFAKFLQNEVVSSSGNSNLNEGVVQVGVSDKEILSQNDRLIPQVGAQKSDVAIPFDLSAGDALAFIQNGNLKEAKSDLLVDQSGNKKNALNENGKEKLVLNQNLLKRVGSSSDSDLELLSTYLLSTPNQSKPQSQLGERTQNARARAQAEEVLKHQLNVDQSQIYLQGLMGASPLLSQNNLHEKAQKQIQTKLNQDQILGDLFSKAGMSGNESVLQNHVNSKLTSDLVLNQKDLIQDTSHDFSLLENLIKSENQFKVLESKADSSNLSLNHLNLNKMTTEDFINHRQNLGDHFEKIKAETSVSPQGAFVLPTATMAVSESLSLSQPQNTNIVQNHTVSLSESLSLVPPILTLANQGGGSIKLKVNPKELGEVIVTVAHEKGKLNVKLETQTHEARELIVNSMSELKNALAQARYEVADLQVVAKAEQKVSAPLTSHAFDNQGFWSEQNSDQRQQSQTWDRWSDARDFYENTKRQNQYKKQYELAMRA